MIEMRTVQVAELQPEYPFAVYYFSADGSYYDMGLDNDGLFKNGFGSGFFDESSNLKYDLLSLNEKGD